MTGSWCGDDGDGFDDGVVVMVRGIQQVSGGGYGKGGTCDKM